MGPLAEFLSSGADQLARLHWGAAVLAVAAALLWTRVFRPPRLNQMGFWIAIAAGVLAAWLFTAWIDPNVDAAVGDLVRGLGLGSQLDPHPQRITATVIEQILALAGAVYCLHRGGRCACRRPRCWPPARALVSATAPTSYSCSSRTRSAAA